jgi:Fe-S cluster biogenesis protein NfuA
MFAGLDFGFLGARDMFIMTERTPNPQTMKFLPEREVMKRGTLEFVKGEGGEDRSPLAKRLFELGGVERIFLGGDFVSVSKSPDEDWDELQPRVLASLMEHYLSGVDVVSGDFEGEEVVEGESEVVVRIRELIETRVRPAVAQDGGDIVFQGFDRGIVYVLLRGACAGCPSATATLKMGIENMLRHYVPEVVEVRAVM